MKTLTRNASPVKPAAVVLFTTGMVGRLHNPAFGRGLDVTRSATLAEALDHYLATTFSVEEKRIADRFNVSLPEARDLIAEGEDAIRSAELDRLAAWESVNDAPDPDGDGGPTVEIGGRGYAVRSIPAGECGSVAYRLTKADGTAYDLIRTHFGAVECDCGDYQFRHAHTDRVCKHGAALIDAGLIRRPSPARRLATA